MFLADEGVVSRSRYLVSGGMTKCVFGETRVRENLSVPFSSGAICATHLASMWSVSLWCVVPAGENPRE